MSSAYFLFSFLLYSSAPANLKTILTASTLSSTLGINFSCEKPKTEAKKTQSPKIFFFNTIFTYFLISKIS